MGLFTSENGTIAQLKNSGFLRLLSETEVPPRIGHYEGLVAITKTLEASDFEHGTKYIEDFISQHFTPENLFALSNIASLLKDSFEPVNKNMRNINRENLTQFSANLMQCKINSEYLIAYYKLDEKIATQFIQYLQKEYDIQ